MVLQTQYVEKYVFESIKRSMYHFTYMIDTNIHRRILLNILKDIYTDTELATWLGFKGGTCLYFFHQLPRFSTDLDFNLLVKESDFNPQKIQNIITQYIKVKDYSAKKNTHFWLGSYNETDQNVKIEISTRPSSDAYEVKELYGVSVLCMKKAWLFAHKLCAIHGRKNLTNRDLFDAHYMFQKLFPLQEDILKNTTGMELKKYFQLLVEYIPSHLNRNGILHGMGHLLNTERKQWAKEHLVEELLFYLRSYGQTINK
jgi:hypothetical protein